jgi:uncharacterized membrane protein YkvA (DUF1232 family)
VDRANVSPWQVTAQRLNEEAYTLGPPAYRYPRLPTHAGIFVALLIGYVFSPINHILGFILVAGVSDEIIVVPLGAPRRGK